MGALAQALLAADVRPGFEAARGFIDAHSAAEGALVEMLHVSDANAGVAAGSDESMRTLTDTCRQLLLESRAAVAAAQDELDVLEVRSHRCCFAFVARFTPRTVHCSFP